MTYILEMSSLERAEVIDALQSHSRQTRLPSELLGIVRRLRRDEGLVIVGDGEMPELMIFTGRRESQIPVAYKNRETQRRETVHVQSDPDLVDRVVRGLAMDRVITSVRDALTNALDDAEVLTQQIDITPEVMRDMLAALSLSLEDARRALSEITGSAESVTEIEGVAVDQPETGRSPRISKHSRTGQ
jgi:hypothetical protein